MTRNGALRGNMARAANVEPLLLHRRVKAALDEMDIALAELRAATAAHGSALGHLLSAHADVRHLALELRQSSSATPGGER